MSNTTHRKAESEDLPLKIWQQNLNKSKTCQLDIIASRRLTAQNIDVLAIQEPYISRQGKTIAARDWVVIYPSTHEKDASKTRSILMVRSNILMDDWEQLEFNSGDVMAIWIKGAWGQLVIFNIYNDCPHNETIKALTKYHNSQSAEILG